MTGHRLSAAEVYARALACSIRQATRALTWLWQEAGLSPAYIEAILRERRWVHGPAAPARGRRRQAQRPAHTEPTTPLGPSSGRAGSSGPDGSIGCWSVRDQPDNPLWRRPDE